MANDTPEVGDAVLHHGRYHEITGLGQRARVAGDDVEAVRAVTFENERYEVTGFAHELEWSDEDDAWYLPGRVLCRDERAVHEAVVGIWPKAYSHHAARRYLDTIELEFKEDGGDVSRDALVDVLQRRKQYDVPEGESWDEGDWRTHAEDCLKHCREVRAIREEG